MNGASRPRPPAASRPGPPAKCRPSGSPPRRSWLASGARAGTGARFRASDGVRPTPWPPWTSPAMILCRSAVSSASAPASPTWKAVSPAIACRSGPRRWTPCSRLVGGPHPQFQEVCQGPDCRPWGRLPYPIRGLIPVLSRSASGLRWRLHLLSAQVSSAPHWFGQRHRLKLIG